MLYLTIVLIQVLHSLRQVLGLCYLLILLHHAGSKHPTHTYSVTEKSLRTAEGQKPKGTRR